jgi:hypothetical protein
LSQAEQHDPGQQAGIGAVGTECEGQEQGADGAGAMPPSSMVRTPNAATALSPTFVPAATTTAGTRKAAPVAMAL